LGDGGRTRQRRAATPRIKRTNADTQPPQSTGPPIHQRTPDRYCTCGTTRHEHRDHTHDQPHSTRGRDQDATHDPMRGHQFHTGHTRRPVQSAVVPAPVPPTTAAACANAASTPLGQDRQTSSTARSASNRALCTGAAVRNPRPNTPPVRAMIQRDQGRHASTTADSASRTGHGTLEHCHIPRPNKPGHCAS
jgi:hypothetical protein